jgi:hypothetical protein
MPITFLGLARAFEENLQQDADEFCRHIGSSSIVYRPVKLKLQPYLSAGWAKTTVNRKIDWL